MRKIRLNKTWRIVLLSLCAFIIIILLVAYLAKGWLMDKAVAKMQQKLKSKYGISLTFKDYGLEGWRHVHMEGISCLTENKDTLMYFDQVSVDIKLLPALFGKLRLKDIAARNGLVDVGRLRDLKSLKTEKPATQTGDTGKFAKIKKYVGYLENAASMMPDNFDVNGLRLNYTDSSDTVHAFVDSMSYHHEQLMSVVRLAIKGQPHTWTTKGYFDRSSLKADVTVSTEDIVYYNFNFIKKLAKADIGFHQFRFRLDELDNTENNIVVKGMVSGQRVYAYNPRLTDDTVSVRNGALDFNATLSPDRIVLDSSSRVTMNEVSGRVGGLYVYKGHQIVQAKLYMPPTEAQKLINSFPDGTFTSVKGMRMEGQFAYKLNFYFDMFTKDTIHIDSDLDGFNLKILQYGEANLDKLKGSFVYYPYNSKRAITVGPENPKFTPLDQISPFLRSAVITSEDPSFFYHHGFVEEALEQSFIKNVKTGEFKRGGSTISMQLVKNVFLTHKKTIARKMEEAFLVWLIENEHIVSKSRMLEVYLNVIEWGPNVYGVGEAAPFYFNTSPANLTLSEGIYLATIIPQPLGFQWRFDSTGNLKDYMQHRLAFIENLMARRRLVAAEDTATFIPNVFVSGPARGYLKIAPSPADTTNEEQDIDWNDILDLR